MNARILAILALALAGCGGGGSSSSATPAGVPSKFLYAYAINGGDAMEPTGGIYGLAVYPGGVLSMLPGPPAQMGLIGAGIAITRDSKALFSANGNLELLAFQINEDGSLTTAPVPSYQIGEVVGLAVHPTADFLYVSLAAPLLAVYAIDSATGALSQTSSVTFGNATISSSAVITPNGGYLYQSYVSNEPPTLQTLQIAGFSTNTATGALGPVPGSPLSSAIQSLDAGAMVIDPTGKFLYVGYIISNALGGEGGGGVAAYSIDAASGGLSAVPGSPFSVGGIPGAAAIDASGKFLIVSTSPVGGGAAGNCLAVLSIDPGTGALAPVPGSPFGPFQTCESVVADPSEEYVYAGSNGTVSVLAMDQATGELTLISQANLAGATSVYFIALTH